MDSGADFSKLKENLWMKTKDLFTLPFEKGEESVL